MAIEASIRRSRGLHQLLAITQDHAGTLHDIMYDIIPMMNDIGARVDEVFIISAPWWRAMRSATKSWLSNKVADKVVNHLSCAVDAAPKLCLATKLSHAVDMSFGATPCRDSNTLTLCAS